MRHLLDQVAQHHCRDVQVDDVIDATVAFITAEARHGELVSLTSTPTHDQEGLPLEMVYLKTQ